MSFWMWTNQDMIGNSLKKVHATRSIWLILWKKKKRKIHSLTDNDCCHRLELNSKFSNLGSVVEWLVSAALEIWPSRVQAPPWPLAGFVPGSPWFNSSAALVLSQQLFLLPVGIGNLFSSLVVYCGYFYSSSYQVVAANSSPTHYIKYYYYYY